MKEVIKLCSKNILLLPKEVPVPLYERSRVKCGIVHIGVGSFHRSHEAFYTDHVLHQKGTTNWGICGVALLQNDRKIFDTLVNQNGLYTLMVIQPDSSVKARVIGSITEYLFAPDNPFAVLEKMADPGIKIISLTITEGGYNFDSATGEFLINDPSVKMDLSNPEKPKTVFGYLTQALKMRRDRQLPGLTLQSCDNIQKNGDVLRKMLLAYVKVAEPRLVDWIAGNVTFPNSMVDRITPVTRQSDIENLKSVYAIDDAWPVTCEPFIQWVIEDNYSYGRPEWGSAGVQFVQDVEPFEKMKIRLLNAGHSLLGFIGSLHGFNTIDETVRFPLLGRFLREFMDIEVTPVLSKVEGVDLGDYKDSIVQRFGNPNIKDQLSRICGESSAKIPKFLLPTIKEQLEKGGPVERGATVIAAWCRYLELAGTPGHNWTVHDNMKDVLTTGALSSQKKDPLAFLKIETIFNDLAENKRFTDIYLPIIESLRNNEVTEVIKNLIEISGR